MITNLEDVRNAGGDVLTNKSDEKSINSNLIEHQASNLYFRTRKPFEANYDLFIEIVLTSWWHQTDQIKIQTTTKIKLMKKWKQKYWYHPTADCWYNRWKMNSS